MKNLNLFIAVSFVAILIFGIFSCQKENKLEEDNDTVMQNLESRSVLGCGPEIDEDICDIYDYNGILIPTILGCDALVSFSVQICPNPATPHMVDVMSIYNVQINFSSQNCNALVDSIVACIIIGDQACVNQLLTQFNGMAANGIEKFVFDTHLEQKKEDYECGDNALVHVEFFASRCQRFCTGTMQFCGFGCCKRSRGYCYERGVLRISYSSVTQSSPCQTVMDPCNGTTFSDCESSNCGMLTQEVGIGGVE